MKNRVRTSVGLFVVVLIFAGSALARTGTPAGSPPSVSGAAQQATKIQDFPGVVNFAPVDDTFACGGAMKPEAAAELKKRGYNAVVNFRPSDEEGANVASEKEAVEKAGMKFIHAPFRHTDANFQSAVDTFLAAVKDPANRPMLFHCASGGRASAMWFFKRVLVDGWTIDKALPEAESIGLTSAALKTLAVDYVKKAQAK
ncbi:MAG: sulfur transferase domain-containing protein [Acidobacteria bacterium]|nr:sulfur transferase domain-containing protein [Acidobacteriota bacterium]